MCEVIYSDIVKNTPQKEVLPEIITKSVLVASKFNVILSVTLLPTPQTEFPRVTNRKSLDPSLSVRSILSSYYLWVDVSYHTSVLGFRCYFSKTYD